MAEDTETTEETQETTAETQETKTLTQADIDKIVQERVARERAKYADYDDLKAKAEKLAEFEEAQKSEADKLKDRIAELEPTAKEASRLRVALEKGLTVAQAKRLVGETEEDLAADADQLLEDLGEPRPRVPERPKGQGGGNKPSDTDPGDMSKLADSILGTGL